MSITDRELVRRAAVGVARLVANGEVAPGREATALAGVALGLHACAALLSADPYRQEMAAVILHYWGEGQVEALNDRLRSTFRELLQCNAEPDALDGERPSR
jgi:hypothetical protein